MLARAYDGTELDDVDGDPGARLYGHVRPQSGAFAGGALPPTEFFGVGDAECVFLTIITLMDGGVALEGEPDLPGGYRPMRLLIATLRVFPGETSPLSRPRRLAVRGSALDDDVLIRVASVARDTVITRVLGATQAFLRDSVWTYLLEGGEGDTRARSGRDSRHGSAVSCL